MPARSGSPCGRGGKSMQRASARLLKMSDSRAPRDPAADLRGRTVVDAEGQDCGWIQDVYVDASEGVPRLLVIEDADLLGLGPSRFLLPAEAITQVQPYTVRIGQATG